MNILLKPVITEKATADSELKNRFTFLVDTNANKVQIKKAVEETYGVSVDKVRTMSYDIVINRRREKLMLEMLFIKKDAYEG
jgi:ribosomal protein L23